MALFLSCYVRPVGCLATKFFLVCTRFIASVGRILHPAVINWHVVLGLPLLPAALAELFECNTKLLRHEVVDDWIDSTVGVDAHAAEEKEPRVEVRRVYEGVDNHHCSVRHPQQGEENDHHNQHLCDLLEQRRRPMSTKRFSAKNTIRKG